jgi:phosphoribosylformylglycinamidine synthase
VALAESAIAGGTGCEVEVPGTGRADGLLFGESQSRIVVSLPEKDLEAARAVADGHGAPFTIIGRVQGSALALGDRVRVPLASARQAWQNGVAEALAAEG